MLICFVLSTEYPSLAPKHQSFLEMRDTKTVFSGWISFSICAILKEIMAVEAVIAVLSGPSQLRTIIADITGRANTQGKSGSH